MKKYIKFSLLIFNFIISSIVIAKPLVLLKEVNNINSNYIYFINANESLDRFNKEPSQLYAGDFIKKSIKELDKINLNKIKDQQEYEAERKQWLILHLDIIATIDRYYNPYSSPTFYLNVLPHEIDGVYYPCPIDPNKIKDPTKRADYEHRIKENEKNRRDADLQLILKILLGKDPNQDPKKSYIEELKKKIPIYYLEYSEDEKEYKEVIEQSSLSLELKKEFFEIL